MSAAVASLLLAAATAAPPITALAFAPEGSGLAVGSQAGLEVRTWPELKPSRRLETQLVHVHALAFSPDGTRLAAAGGSPAEHGTLELFSWPAGELLHRVRCHGDVAYGIAWRSDSAVVATAGLDGDVTLVDAAGGNPLRTLTGHSRGVTAVVFITDDVLVSAGLDQALRVWDLAAGRVVRTLDNHTRPVSDLALRPNQADGPPPMLASVGEDRTVRLWQPTIGRMVRFVRLEQAVPLAVRWSRCGDVLLVTCDDGRLRSIDADTARVVHEAPAIDGWAYALDVPPNGAEAAVGGAEGRVVRLSCAPRQGARDPGREASSRP